jgi:putative inorganic carbon (HCO3(-)) transporter
MFKDSVIINGINKFLAFSQEKFRYLWENSIFMQNIDNFIFITIMAVLICSAFASSDILGYIGLITIFLTIVKLLIKKDEKIDGTLFDFFILLYFLLVIVSLAGSSMFHLSLKGFLKTFTYLGFYFSAVQYFKNNKSKIWWAVGAIALCASIESIIGLVQSFAQVDEISGWQDMSQINPEDVLTRVYGTLQPFNPNLLGGYFVATFPCLLGGAIYNFVQKRYVWAALATFFSCLTAYTIVLTGCRGAYIGLFVMLLATFCFLGRYIWEIGSQKLKTIYLSTIGALAAFAVCLVAFVSSIRTRVISIFVMRDDSSTSFRLNVYHSAINMIKDNWALGIGLGNQNFREIYGLYMRTGFDALSAYSIYLETAVESGIFALLAFLAFLGTFLYKTVKFVIGEHKFEDVILVGIALISVLGVMVHGFVDTVFFRPQLQFVFWTMIASAAAILKISAKEDI